MLNILNHDFMFFSFFIPRNTNGSFEKKYVIISSEEMSDIILEHYNQTIQFGNAESDVVDNDTDAFVDQ